MKKLLGFLLSLCLLFGACFGVYYYMSSTGYMGALAQEFRTLFSNALKVPVPQAPIPESPTPEQQPGDEQGGESQTPPQTGPGYDEEGRLVDPDEALDALLYAAATEFEEEVDISHLDYTSDTLEGEVSRFFFTHPDLFYVDNGYSILTNSQSKVQKIKLRYLTTPAVAQTRLTFYNNVLDEVVAGIPAGATDFDKALYLHDYLVQNYAYDYEGLAEEQASGESVAVRDAYTFFYGKVGVCQAYMLAMIALCKEAGLECLPVTSDAMQHAWNLVKLDGKWYHVDVTWDDAGGEESAVYPSYVSYKYFLLSGEALYNSGRTALWLSGESASSTTYDSALWHGASTPMCKNGEDYFCVVYDTAANAPKIYRGSPTEMTATQTMDAKWYSGPMTYYKNAWASIVVWEDVMLVSTAKGFLYYDVATDTLTEAVDLAVSLGGKQIFGVCEISDGGLVTFVAAADYHGVFEERTWQIPVSS